MSGLSQTEYAFKSAFNEISSRIYTWAQSKGFWDHAELTAEHMVSDQVGKPASIPNPSIFAEKIALIHTELSEALEADRDRVPGSDSASPR